MNLRSLTKKIIPTNLFRKIEPLGHLFEAIIAQVINGFPAKNLKVIGVTGTDGKTTTSTLIKNMLRESGLKVAMMSTISVDYGDGRGEQPNPTRLTTVGAFGLVKQLKKIKDSGAEWLVLETTSHALAQHRVWGIPYSIVVMTNMAHEHLDYHKTFENYRAAKMMMFEQCNRNKKGYRIGIINGDDPSHSHFASKIAHPILYGQNNADLKATDINLSSTGSLYNAQFNGDTLRIKCNLPGSFNVYNSLATVGVGKAIGLTNKQIEQGIESLNNVEGRMNSVNEGQNYVVIVDYAHTPESFEKLFKEIRPLTKNKVIAVFGSAGRRDEAKRAKQGLIAGKLCDIVIATEEDDRDIDGQEILEQIASGAEEAGKRQGEDLFLIHDREKAIAKAINIAKDGDIVLLLGKGHEKSILSNGPDAAKLRHLPQDDMDSRRVSKRDFDEVSVAREAIKTRNKLSS